MSYLVLARKWRPKRFAELVGQQHVVRALTHALETGRVHHAFLFTGTRGVGKTTIARIFAKSLNCETGTTSDPCGVCGTCLEIDNGRYPDLIEIDAASHTGVDNIRDLIENAQYKPSRGRIKVFLIDEVHMLSKPAFNALLKTLEEPPDHVKFLLATTDPEKLPITVLSRCLQFNLRRLEQEQIAGQLRHILAAEQIVFDDESILQLAVSADGSLRDGLSLLDQAIAFTGGTLQADSVRAMLGTVDRNQIEQLLRALCARDGSALFDAISQLATFSPDFSQVLDRLAENLHEIQMAQLVPAYQATSQRVSIKDFAQAMDPQVIQLWYQMAVLAKKDLYLAPSARMGFEMGLLRMLAFVPVDSQTLAVVPVAKENPKKAMPAIKAAVIPAPAALPEAAPPAVAMSEQTTSLKPSPEPNNLDHSEDWMRMLSGLLLKGPEREIALHASFVSFESPLLKLAYPINLFDTLNETLINRLQAAVSQALQKPVQIKIEKLQAQQTDTLFDRETQKRQGKMQNAEAEFQNHPVVTALLQEGGQILPDSIKPLELK